MQKLPRRERLLQRRRVRLRKWHLQLRRRRGLQKQHALRKELLLVSRSCRGGAYSC